MRFSALALITVILLVALAASIWFWIAMLVRQAPSDTEETPAPGEETNTLCAEFRDEQSECASALSLALTQFPGVATQVKKVSSETFHVQVPPEFYWVTTIRLSDPIEYAGVQLFGEIRVGIGHSSGALLVFPLNETMRNL